jgi:hypothetical protein
MDQTELGGHFLDSVPGFWEHDGQERLLTGKAATTGLRKVNLTRTAPDHDAVQIGHWLVAERHRATWGHNGFELLGLREKREKGLGSQAPKNGFGQGIRHVERASIVMKLDI